MTQTVPATAVLGPGKTELTIGYRVLNLDGTEYAAFATTGVSETSIAGTYRKASGVVAPDAGGYIVWGVAGTDYAEAPVSPAAAKPGDVMTIARTGSVIYTEGATLDDLLDELDAAHGDGSWEGGGGGGGGVGTGSYSDTITDGAAPLDGVRVQLSTDSAGTNLAYEAYTDALGVFAMRPDPGTYYRWLDLAGYTFTQGVEVTVT